MISAHFFFLALILGVLYIAQVAPKAELPETTFFVASDIQGDLAFRRALANMHDTDPKAKTFVINGDITGNGLDTVPNRLQQIYWAIGNHDLYAAKIAGWQKFPNGVKEETMFRRFKEFDNTSEVYYERVHDVYPFLFLGTEKYMHYHDPELYDEVFMSADQLKWLEKRLQLHEGSGRPVFVYSHHVLKDTISGTDALQYGADYIQAKELLEILGKYTRVILFTGHTHWDLNLSDWTVRKSVKGGSTTGFQYWIYRENCGYAEEIVKKRGDTKRQKSFMKYTRIVL
ncbi:uncharacterized protein VTP21DRAFT_3235 [Calcarisporiella thermophila]|uniref:uncharacterized protein n=1 Tax=Calcarisporiella thermophila TaxID=911321 RepID=UPI003742B277